MGKYLAAIGVVAVCCVACDAMKEPSEVELISERLMTRPFARCENGSRYTMRRANFDFEPDVSYCEIRDLTYKLVEEPIDKVARMNGLSYDGFISVEYVRRCTAKQKCWSAWAGQGGVILLSKSRDKWSVDASMMPWHDSEEVPECSAVESIMPCDDGG